MLKKVIFLLTLLLFVFSGCNLFDKDNDQAQPASPSYEHNLDDPSPFMGGSIFGIYKYNIEFQGKIYSEDAIRVIAAERLTEKDSLEIEKELPGIFCGMKTVYAKFSKYDNDVYQYDFCLTPKPSSGEELFSIINEMESFKDFVSVDAYTYVDTSKLQIAPAD
jgi:hypothetical protein